MASTSFENSKKRKRTLIDIASKFILRDTTKAFCNIDPEGNCTYVQERFDVGNFIRHFRLKHGELANANGLLKDFDSTVKKPRVIPKHSIPIDQQLLIESTVKLTTYHQLPISCFEWEGFKDLLGPITTALGCTLNRVTMREHHTKIAMRLKEILREEMHGKLICLKIDSAARYHRHILGINVQYALGDEVVIRTLGKCFPKHSNFTFTVTRKKCIHREFHKTKFLPSSYGCFYNEFVSGMIQVKESQTAAFLKSKILETLTEYELSVEQIFSVTCDNGANIVATVKKLKHELEITHFLENDEDADEEDLFVEKSVRDISEELCVEFQERINLVRCAVHTLQLAILDVVNKSNTFVESLTNVAKKCKQIKYRTFFEFHKASYPPVWSQTRWGGVFKMVESFKVQKEFFIKLADQFCEFGMYKLILVNSYHVLIEKNLFIS